MLLRAGPNDGSRSSEEPSLMTAGLTVIPVVTVIRSRVVCTTKVYLYTRNADFGRRAMLLNAENSGIPAATRV